MEIQAIKTKIFPVNHNLIDFIRHHIKTLPEKSVLVVTSKIVALSEGRVRFCATAKEKDELIKSECDFAIKTPHAWLTIKDGLALPSAGVDESNGNGQIILLPKNSFLAAAQIRRAIKKLYHLKKLGVIITDSRLLPLRAGVVGIALGYAGFKGIRDYRGKPDIFGRKLQVSRTDIADSLATAAVLLMGEGKERQPLAIIKNAPIEFTERVNPRELRIDIKKDIYRPLFEQLKNQV